MDKKNILFLNFGGIGDEILFLPTIQSVKNLYPNSKITLALEPRSKCIKELTDLIDETIDFDIKSQNKFLNAFDFLQQAWAKKYDMVISSGSSMLVSLLLFLTGIRQRYGYNSGFLSNILLSKSVKLNKSQYASNMYNELVSPLGEFEYSLPKIEAKSEQKDFVLIHPGVSKMSVDKGIIKTLSPEKWAELIKQASLKYKVVLVGGPDDKSIIGQIQELLEKDNFDNYENYFGKTKNIKELAELINSSKVFVCVDSAPMHIGVALDKNLVTIFGPTDEKKLLPQKDNFKIAKTKVSCRPCLWEKREKNCKVSKCLDVNISQILEKIEQFFEAKNVY